MLHRIAAVRAIAQMPHEQFAHVRKIILQILRGVELLLIEVFKMPKHLVESVFNRLLCVRAFAADISRSRRRIELNRSNSCPILPAIALFLHQKVQFVQAVKSRTIFFMVKIKWFEKSDKCYTALVFD